MPLEGAHLAAAEPVLSEVEGPEWSRQAQRPQIDKCSPSRQGRTLFARQNARPTPAATEERAPLSRA